MEHVYFVIQIKKEEKIYLITRRNFPHKKTVKMFFHDDDSNFFVLIIAKNILFWNLIRNFIFKLKSLNFSKYIHLIF